MKGSKTWIRLLIPIVLSFGMTVLLFWKVFLGYVPFPGDFLTAWYEPWKTETSRFGSLGVAHKPVLDDVFRQLYPYKILTSDFFRNGTVPLWNSFNGSGMPFLAVMHAGFFSPLIVLFLLLKGPLAWTLYIMIQPIIFSLGCYWYTRQLGLSRIAAFFSTAIVLLSGFSVVRYEFGEYIYVAACLPFILAIIEQYRKNISTRSVFFIPFIILFMMISGQPQMIFYVLLLSAVYGLSISIIDRISPLPIVVSYILGFCLSAFQLIPTFELYMNANMTTRSSQFIFDRFLLPFEHYLSLFIPNYFGNPATYNFWEKGDYVETMLYVGMIPFFFVIVWLCQKSFGKRKFLTVFYIATCILTLLFTINWPLTRWLYSLPIPIIGTGVPTRVFFLTVFSIAILAGLGLDSFLKETIVLKKPILISIGIIAGIFLLTLISKTTHVSCVESVVHNCWIVALRSTTVRNIFLECTFFFLALFSLILYKRFGRITAYVIIVLFCISGSYNAFKFLPFSRPSTILPDIKIIDVIKNVAGYNRIVGIGGAELPTDIATYFHFYDPQFYDPLYLKRYGELFSYAKAQDKQLELTRSDVVFSGSNTNDLIVKKRIRKLMQLVSVGNILYKKEEFGKMQIPSDQVVWEDASWVITKNPDFLPRVSIIPSYEYIPDDDTVLARLFDSSFDPKKTVILEERVPEMNGLDHKAGDNNAQIQSFFDKNNEIRIHSDSQEDGFLLLTDNYYPGWKAYVDNKEVKIYRANYTFRTVFMPEGIHDIAFKYQPISMNIGIIISVCTLLIIGIYFISRSNNE